MRGLKPMMRRVLDVFGTAFVLGCTAFGGPIAHLAHFHRVYVARKQWIDAEAYASWVALCTALPGPTSSQVGIAIGKHRAGWAGAFAAWVGFTLPAAVLMTACALLFHADGELLVPNALRTGCTLAAVAVVMHALIGMARTYVTVSSVPFVALGAVALWLSPWTFTALLGGIIVVALGFRTAVRALWRIAPGVGALIAPLIALPLIAYYVPEISFVEAFYRAGVLVFGGGHIVLPVLESSLTLTSTQWLYGYGVMQALPGPLFAFAAYVGALLGGVFGACAAVLLIFLPSFVLVGMSSRFVQTLYTDARWKRVLGYVHGCTVGILALTACTFAIDVIHRPTDTLIVALCAVLLYVRVAAVAVVPIGALLVWLRDGWGLLPW